MNNFFALQPNTTCFNIDRASAFATAVNRDVGIFRLTKLAQNILKIVREILIQIGKVLYVPQITRAITHFNSACKALLLNKLFSSAVDFKKTYDKSDRISQKLMYDALEFTGDLLTASGYFGAIRLAKASNFTSLVNKIIDTKKNLGKVVENDSAKISSFESKCSYRKYISALSLGLIKHPLMTEEHPADLRRVAMLKLAKDITSLALLIVGITGLLTGVYLLSQMAILAMSSISIVLALTASVESETTLHKLALLNANR